jgi:uncharacterized protein YggU (UPF0235/DUF167 family)
MLYKVNVECNKEFFSIEEDQIVIEIKTNPTKEEANKENIKKLAKYFKISTSLIKIKQCINQIKRLYKYKIREFSFCLNRVLKIEKYGIK